MTNPSKPGGSKDAHSTDEDVSPPVIHDAPPILLDDSSIHSDPEDVLEYSVGITEEEREERSDAGGAFASRPPDDDERLNCCGSHQDDFANLLYGDPLFSFETENEAGTNGTAGLKEAGEAPTQNIDMSEAEEDTDHSTSNMNMAGDDSSMVDDESMKEDDRKLPVIEYGKEDRSFSSEKNFQKKKKNNKSDSATGKGGGTSVASVDQAEAHTTMPCDNASSMVGDKGATNQKESDKNSERGNYKCGKCRMPNKKEGHECPHEPAAVEITAKNLEAFTKSATKFVNERTNPTLSLPRWFVQKEDKDNNIEDKGANNDEKSHGKKRGKYNCGKCSQPKKGHICPYDLLCRELTSNNLDSFIKLVTKLVSERGTLNLPLPSW